MISDEEVHHKYSQFFDKVATAKAIRSFEGLSSGKLFKVVAFFEGTTYCRILILFITKTKVKKAQINSKFIQ